jgi:hypothetical protein
VYSENADREPPTQADLLLWAKTFGHETVPVLGLEAQQMDDPEDLLYQYESDWIIPSIYHLAPDMTVLSADTQSADPSPWL